MHDEPEGYRIPLRTSLTRPLLLAGVPRTFAILNATVAAAIAFGLQQPLIGLPLWIVIQSAGAYATARDPGFSKPGPAQWPSPPSSGSEP